MTPKNLQLLIFFILWLLSKIGESVLNFIKLLFFPIHVGSYGINRFLSYSQTKKISKKNEKQLQNYTPSFAFMVSGKKARLKKRGRPKKHSEFILFLHRVGRFLKNLIPSPIRFAIIFGVLFSIFFFYSLFLIVIAHNLPTPEKLSDTNSPLTTEFYDRHGELLYRLYEGKNRSLVKLNELPPFLIQATIATEDKNFYGHSGVDISAIVRAVVAYIEKQPIQGGSTITQQLIKNTLLTPEQTLQRKVKEIFLAFWVERLFSKDEILQMYFNEVAYGGPAWGIYAASQTYFGKEPQDLTLTEGTFLAGLPASPTTYSPYGSQPELGKQRQQEVLRRMVEEGYISPDQANKTFEEKLTIKPTTTQIKAPHFVMYTRQQLVQKYGEKMVSQGGLKVITTLDLNIQEMAEEVVSQEVSELAYLNVGNGAAMVTDAKTGHILAMVGSKNYWDEKNGNFNVTTALRQPGSSVKPITYVTAFKEGYSPGNILLDTPITFKNAWESYSPGNYDGKFHGAVTIRTALAASYNIPAVKALALVGVPKMIQTAQEMGITTFNDPGRYGLSLTLGAGEVKMTDMMTVYGTFSQNGLRFDTQPVLKVTDSKGVVLEDNSKPQGKRVLSPAVAYMITDILADNKARTPAFGPNSLLNIPGYTVPVKTGTTDNKKDNLAYGYTPNYVVGAWVGNNDGEPLDPKLSSGITGATPIWNLIMTNLLSGKPNVAFEKPPEIVEKIVDGNRDITVNGLDDRTAVGFTRKRMRDGQNNLEKDSITFTDPFSTYTPPVETPKQQ